MANPQVEDGYTKIANELLEALIRLMPGNTESRIMLAVIRKTYGWCKKEDCISINQLADMTCKSRRMAIYAVQNLEAKKMLNVRRNKGRGHINEINKISLNKNYSEWVVQEKSSQYRKALESRKIYYEKSKERVVQEKKGSARTCKRVVQYSCTHKRNITKETIYSVEFLEFWKNYPSRNGKKLDKKKCFSLFSKLNKQEREEVNVAAKNYAKSKRVLDGFTKDPERFLEDKYWRECIEPETKSRRFDVIGH